MYPIPSNEAERIAAVKSYEILDSLPEKEYDELTSIASAICQTPVSLISLLDDTRQWFKSKHGVDMQDTPREHAFCSHTIMNPHEVLVVPDSRMDVRFKDNPLVKGDPSVIFYAGAPLLTPEGYPLGSICVIDTEARQLEEWQINALRTLASHVVTMMELRKVNRVNARMRKIMEQRIEELQKSETHIVTEVQPQLAALRQRMDDVVQRLENGEQPNVEILKSLQADLAGIDQSITS